MCTVTVNVNESQIRKANPSLTSMEAISRWVQYLVDTCIADLAYNDETLKPYTMEELNARIDRAESEAAAGLGEDHEEVFRKIRERFAHKKEYEMTAAIVLW